MEIELKYLLTEDIARERSLDDKHLLEIKDPDSDETIRMCAVYFDTADGDLQRREMAFRVREENDRKVATLKWGGSAENGLHVRGELNVPVEEAFCSAPHVDIFKGSEIYEEIAGTVGEKALLPVMHMEFTRQQMRVDTGKSISVISLDDGVIRTANGEVPIAELEIELYSGDQEDMVRLGEELAAKYNLAAGDCSKFQKGLALLRG